MRKIKSNLIWVLIAAIFATGACKKDDNSTPLIEDGGYIVGASTISTSLDLKGMMSSGQVEGAGYAAVAREGMYEKFTYISSTGDGFNFVVKSGTTEVTYGLKSSTKGTLTLTGTSDQITGVVDTGAVIIDGANITVATSGFYHVVLDITTMGYYVIPINNWNIKLTDDIELTPGTISQTSATWSKTSVELRKGTYKFRYDKGWKVNAHGNGASGFKIFTNFGGTTDALAIGGSNIAMALADEGKYTVTLKWNPIDGFTMTLTDKVAIVPIDPATFVWSLIGDAVGGWADANDVNFIYQSKANNVYTYKINSVTLLGTKAFKVRRDHAWTNNFGYAGATIAGDPTNFTASGDGNFVVGTTKTYSITYELDWANDKNKLIFTVIP